MNYKTHFILTLLTTFLLLSCFNDDDTHSEPIGFIDYGFIPEEVSLSNEFSPFQSAIYHNGSVFVATDKGLWKNDLATKQWELAGFEGKVIVSIFKHPTIENKFFVGTQSDGSSTDKTVHISSDGGQTWTEAANPLFIDESSNIYEDYTCFAVRPDNPNHIYANVNGGAMIGVSLDGGMNWTRMNNEPSSYFGYTSNIAFLPNNPNIIFQGSENPLDDAWLATYDIDDTNPILLTNFTKIMDSGDWGNRRPTELKTFTFTSNSVYIGQEGALSKLNGNESKYIFKSENDNFPYTYIYGIWVNPNDLNHIIFGGSLNGDTQPMSLYETFNEGESITRIDNKLGLENPEVREIVATDTYPAIVINDKYENKVKLVIYKYN